MWYICGNYTRRGDRPYRADQVGPPCAESVVRGAALFEWSDLTALVATAGFGLSVMNAYFNWQNRRLAIEQDRRRRPKLVPSLVNGYFQNDKAGNRRNYAFLVTVTNPSDSGNAIAAADLAITYLTREDLQMTMKIRSAANSDLNFIVGNGSSLPIPSPVSAHNAVSGWILFHVPTPMLANVRIEGYRLMFLDAQEGVADIRPILVQEYRDEIKI